MTKPIQFERNDRPVASLVPPKSEDQRVMDYLALSNPNPEFVETMLRHWHMVENARHQLGLSTNISNNSTTSSNFDPQKL